MPNSIFQSNGIKLSNTHNCPLFWSKIFLIKMKVIQATVSAFILISTHGIATADVDLYNEDMITHSVSVQTLGGSKLLSVPSGEGMKNLCQRCTVTLLNASQGLALNISEGSAVLEVSGEDVITIEYGIMRIGENCD